MCYYVVIIPTERDFLICINMPKGMKKTVKNWKNKLKMYAKPLFLLVSVLFFTFPNVTESQGISYKIVGPVPTESIKSYYEGPTLPEITARPARRTMIITVTSYNSEPGQPDDTPFITAFNTRVRDGIVATNFLPKGTIVRFPDKFGDKEFVVEDRMNERYYYRMDIWMADKQEAIQFGIKVLKMEIL